MAKIRKTVAINTPEKTVTGRPTKFTNEMPSIVLEACKEGRCLTIASICVLLGIDRDTYYDWIAKFPTFSDAIKKGLEYRKNHMERMALTGITGEKFNAAPWIFLMKNMFPDEYREKHEVQQSSEMTIKIDMDDQQV